mgnify:CR=1 FL=1
MKKGLLCILGIMTLMSLKATNYDFPTKNTIQTSTIDAVTFIEKGVQFHVYLDGEFNFERPRRNYSYYDYNGSRYQNYSLRIDRDHRGRIKRVGKNSIRYDYRGNVSRIGNIRLYYRNGLLRKIGNLKITYDNWGDPYFHGSVNAINYYNSDIHFSLNFGQIYNYNDSFFYRKEFRNYYRKFKEDRNYYYYKANTNSKNGKRNKIIKRRKSTVTKRNTQSNNRRAQPKGSRSYKKHTFPKKSDPVKRSLTKQKKVQNKTTKRTSDKRRRS